MRGMKIRSAVAPRCLSFSITNEPRKPAPPVTITRLFCQKLFSIISPILPVIARRALFPTTLAPYASAVSNLQHRKGIASGKVHPRNDEMLLHNKLRVSISIIRGVADQTRLQSE